MNTWWQKLVNFFKPTSQVSRSLGGEDFQDWTLKPLPDLIEGYNVTSRAAAEAALDRPSSDSDVPDDFHRSIEMLFTEMVLSRKDEVGKQLADLNVDLGRLEKQSETTTGIEVACRAKIDMCVAAMKQQVVVGQSEATGQKAHLSEFKQTNRINRPAKVTISPNLFFMILIVVVLVESLINGAFFKDLVLGGAAQGVLIAFGISVINVATGLFLGGPLRNKNSIFLGKKILGALTFVFWLLLTLFFNLFVAHVRDGIDSDGYPAGLGSAVGAMQNATFDLNNAFSWFLFLLGIIFALVVLIDKYASNDPYPSYGDKTSASQEFDENLQSLKDEANSKQQEIKEKAVERGERGVTNTLADLTRDEATVAFLKTRVNTQFLEYCRYYESALKAVIDSYRTTNRLSRDTDPPAYFDEPFNLSWEKLDAQDKLDGIDRQINTMRNSVEKVRNNWPNIRADIMRLGETF